MMTSPRPRINDDGFTLAEVLVAIAIVMMVGMAALSGVINALSSQRSAEGTDTAVQVAVDRLETVNQLEWDSIGFYESTRNTTGQTGYDYTPYHPCADTIPCQSEPVVLLHGSPPSTPLHATVTMSGYKVHTYITWVLPTGETVYPVNQEGQRYASKRVRIVVEGTQAGEPVTESVETILAPRVNETPPPGIPLAVSSSTSSTASAPDTCPQMVTATGSPATVAWNAVEESVVPGGYRVFVNGVQHTTVPITGGLSRYAWNSPLYGAVTTYEVRGVSPTGVAVECSTVTWDPANPN